MKLLKLIVSLSFLLPLHAATKEQTVTLSLQPIQSVSAGDSSNGQPMVNDHQNIPFQMAITPLVKQSKVTLKIESFTFNLNTSGFLISQTLMPQDISPTSAKWIDFSAGNQIVGHVFRDGSIRFSGPNNAPLPAGSYKTAKVKVNYSIKQMPSKVKGFSKDSFGKLVRKDNFFISKGLSNMSSANSGFDYGEYYGLSFFDGKIVTATTDNSFDQSATPIAVFNRLNKQGKHLIPQVDIVPEGYGGSTLGEESLSVNPQNKKQLAMTVLNKHTPPSTSLAQGFLGISNDGGKTWNSVNPFANTPTLPIPPPFEPTRTGDQYCIFDSFGNLFYVCLFVATNTITTEQTAFAYVLLSGDGGLTWTLIDFLNGINPNTFGLDYPLMASGPGPGKSAVTWLLLKQDANFDEIAAVGSTLPLMATAYQTTGLGVLKDKKGMELPGTENGGYGSISVGPKGEVLVTGIPVNNALGSLPKGNASIWYTFNSKGFNGNFNGIKIFANSNTGYFDPYLPQAHRNTWVHPNAQIDNKGRWVMVYTDQPSPHVNQPSPNIYLIYSENQGKSWSTPLRLNNDTSNTTFHFMPEISIDNKSNDIVVTWLDSREDELDTSTRLWGTVIKHLPSLSQ